MPRKAYIADLAKATGFHGVHSIHDLAGSQDDGEFHFLFMNQSLVNPIALTARITGKQVDRNSVNIMLIARQKFPIIPAATPSSCSLLTILLILLHSFWPRI